MRISLLYNEDAGEGISADELTDQITRGGHQVVRTVRRGTPLSTLLASPVELVVAAGGDGTIAAAAKAVAGSGIPLAILPLGTANNIAKSLGLEASLPELIEGWRHTAPVPFDLGGASGASGGFTFVEGIGGGLIPAGIAAASRAGENADDAPEHRVAAAIGCFRDALMQLKAKQFSLKVDGADLSGDFLVVEILNISSVGPNIVFAPDVSPADGRLSVVTAGEEHRSLLLSYLENRIADRPAQLSLPSRPATTVEIDGSSTLHLDDQNQRATTVGALTLRIQPAALYVVASAPA